MKFNLDAHVDEQEIVGLEEIIINIMRLKLFL